MQDTTAYSINFDADGQLLSVTINGKEARECSAPPGDQKRVIACWGEDPKNGDGIEIIEYSSGICLHFFCRLYCL